MDLWDKENPTQITYYEPAEKKADCAVVIFPGGAYCCRAEHEGKGYAEFFQSRGIPSFVVDYHVAPDYFPRPLLDARRAVRYVRFHAAEYGIDPMKIAAMGSSAGGHLTAFLSTYREPIEGEGADRIDDISPFPDAQILCYAVTSENGPDDECIEGCYRNLFGPDYKNIRAKYDVLAHTDENTPPAFFWHTFNDPAVHIGHLFRYASALRENNVPAEIHVFPDGPHGLGLAKDRPHVAQWPELLMNWLACIGFTDGTL